MISRPAAAVRRGFIPLALCAIGVLGVAAAGAAAPVSQADQNAQTFVFNSEPPASAINGEDVYTVDARATSNLPVTLSIAADSAKVCYVSESNVFLTGAGTCTVLADQAGDDYWLPADEASQSFVVGKATPQLGAYPASKGVLGLTPTTFSAQLVRRLRIGSPSGPIAGELVSFSVAGRPMCSATTGSDGVATCSATIGLASALKESSYAAVYAGSVNFFGATSAGSLK